jgi:LDH2 family malate/lactate/ureidoglycolate dehydrogenase
MKNISLDRLAVYISNIMLALGLSGENAAAMADIYMYTTKRGFGHHDINNLPNRIDAIKAGEINIRPRFEKLAAFGYMERWV